MAAPARKPAVMSSTESPTYVRGGETVKERKTEDAWDFVVLTSVGGEKEKVGGEGRGQRKARTMIKSWASVKPHVDAMCKMPAGCGFGGRKLRVMMGEICALGRKVWSRWLTGPLFEIHQPRVKTFFFSFSKRGIPPSSAKCLQDVERRSNVLEIPGTNGHSDPLSFQIRHQLLQSRLRLLHQHSCGLDGADLGHGLKLLLRREGVDVLKDVGFGRNGERFSASNAKV